MGTKTSLEWYQRARVQEIERALVKMERNGFKIDTEYCREAEGRAREEEGLCLTELKKWLASLGVEREVNWASPKQLVEVLHDTLQMPPSPIWKKGRVRLDDGERKTDEVALGWISDRVAPNLRRGLTELVRLRRTRGAIKYLGKLPGYIAPDGFVHPVSGPSSDQDDRAGTITWRLGCKNPEVQQIPSDPKKDPYQIRRAFVAPDGYGLLAADERALEVVILAHLFVRLFGDDQLVRMVLPGAPDIHAVNAQRVFGTYLKWEHKGRRIDSYPVDCFAGEHGDPYLAQLRQDIKAVWYGLMYGKTIYGFAISLRDKNGEPIGEDLARLIVRALYDSMPALGRYGAYIEEQVREHHGIPGLGGAWCDLSYLTKSGNKWDLQKAARIARNYPCQEGGARIIGYAMVECTNDPLLQDVLLERQVHDELDFRVPDGAELRATEQIRYHMTTGAERYWELEAPLQVSIGTGQTWFDC